MQLWAAPVARDPIQATVVVPGSKSMTNRALLLAALADGPSQIAAPLRARDSELMARGLYALGVGIDDRDGDWLVQPAGLRGPAAIDVGLAGTVMRFLPPVAALADGPIAFDGDPRAHERPLGPLLGALRALGVDIDDGGRDALPLTVRGRGSVRGGAVTIDASASSQFVSALLLAAARFDRGLEVRHVGGPLPSLPHIAMTVAMVRDAGVEVDDSRPEQWRVEPGAIRARDVRIEPDLSNAAPFLAAALATGGRVTIEGWPAHSTQPGGRLPELLEAMGAVRRIGPDGLTLSSGGRVRGIEADLSDVSELTPVIAALAALADSESRISGVAHIRGHETDRLAALATELSNLGASVSETDDGLIIRPKPLHGGVFSTYEDHRMAHAAALIGLCVDGVQVENIATTTKTLPDFPGMWQGMLNSRRGAAD
jgi:3-phosphoshikimate 1-carboxyvinyltransferase